MKIKRLIYLYIFLLICVIFLFVFLWKISHTDKQIVSTRDLPQIENGGVINIVTDYNSIGYYVSGDTIAGFQYELTKALERDWGIKVNLFLENSLSDNLAGLQSQKYDIVARNIPVNSDLREQFAFTNSITLNKQVLVQRNAASNNGIEPIRKHLALIKKTIYLPKDSPAILRLNNLSGEIGDTIYIKQDSVYDTEQLVMMVASGDIDFTVCDEEFAKIMAERLPEIDIKTDISFTQLESWAVRKDSQILLDSLNSWFSRFKSTKAFKNLYDRYY